MNKKEENGCPARLGRVGGGALIEGVMMRAGEDVAITCRTEDGNNKHDDQAEKQKSLVGIHFFHIATPLENRRFRPDLTDNQVGEKHQDKSDNRLENGCRR